MLWLQRHAWWALFAMAVLIGVVGLWAMIVGITEDPSVPLGLTGLSLSELEAESPNGYRFGDYAVRIGGMGLATIGALLAAIVVFAFRQDRRWAWWAMWILPIWAVGVLVLILAIGVSPGQAPPTPVFSGVIVAVISVALLLVSAPRFFRRSSAD